MLNSLNYSKKVSDFTPFHPSFGARVLLTTVPNIGKWWPVGPSVPANISQCITIITALSA